MEPVQTETLTFEEAFGQLEQTVASLENGDLTLERALALFEEGTQLVRRCNGILDCAELRIEQLSPEGDCVAIADPDERA